MLSDSMFLWGSGEISRAVADVAVVSVWGAVSQKKGFECV